jgi:hypothetical protein
MRENDYNEVLHSIILSKERLFYERGEIDEKNQAGFSTKMEFLLYNPDVWILASS